jgi:hypothetical protein
MVGNMRENLDGFFGEEAQAFTPERQHNIVEKLEGFLATFALPYYFTGRVA